MSHVSRSALFACIAVGLCACATPPEDIQATTVSPSLYEYLDCRQLADYKSGLEATYKLAADQQDEARIEDAIGYVVLQQPLGSERRSSIPDEIADIKGHLVAVSSLETSKNCGQQQASLTPSSMQSEVH